MILKITSKRQVTFPKAVLDALDVGPGDRIELLEEGDGYVLRARRVDESKLGLLRHRLRRGIGNFDVEKFREEPHDPSLRD
jgi:AbrB family looped-hinge helix DNA binding protein